MVIGRAGISLVFHTTNDKMRPKNFLYLHVSTKHLDLVAEEATI